MAPRAPPLVLAAATVGAAAALAAALYHRRRKEVATPRVLLASTAAAKVEAVARALCAEVSGRKTESLVSEQPLGIEETLTGAKNRMQMLLTNEGLLEGDASSPFAYAVAIENGIMKAASNSSVENPSEVWIDLAVVCVRDLRTGATAFSTSAGIQFPADAIGEWVECGQEGTVGDVLTASTGCDKQDPHAFLTHGKYPRAALLEHAVKVAVESLVTPISEGTSV